jgi:ABC-type nitrate/sulfonate/bicarbonate transport system substrate-binding protein
VGRLETKPDSEDLAAVVREDVEAQPAEVQAELRALAEALKAALAAEGRAGTVDNRITVIASGANSIAAGRDVNIGSLPGKP